MPWQASEAKSHTKEADTPSKQSAWAKIANAALKKYKNEGRAIRVANAAIAHMKADALEDAMRRLRKRKGLARDPFGREAGTWEEEEEDSAPRSPLVVIADAPDKPTSMMMYDAVELDDASKLELTSDGYLKAMPRIARSGIQEYRGWECGRDDVDCVRVYRPEASVFASTATHSYTHLPITIDHPGVSVDAKNWKKHAVGETGDEVLRDGGSVRVPMMLRDADAIKLVKDGKRELSVGYACDLEWCDGVTPSGERYDAVQHNIRGNHLAIVAEARGGPTLRIGDTAMSDLKTVIIDGLPCQMSDKDAAIVQRTITQLQDQVENFKKKFAAKEEEEEEEDSKSAKFRKDSEAELEKRDGKITALEQQLKEAQLTTEKLDAAVDARQAVRDQARKLLPTLKHEGKSDAQIRREVVALRLGDDKVKAMSDERIEGAFEAYLATAPAGSPIRDASAAFAPGPGPQGLSVKDAAYAEMVKEMENAWRKPAA